MNRSVFFAMVLCSSLPVTASDKVVRDKVATNTWHTLKLEAAGDHFTVWYDGNKVLDTKDETLKEPGKVGLWTKADSVIEFDDFTVGGR
jgi:hypothetical protein